VPHWVESGAPFHIRIALDREKEQKALIDPALAQAIFDSAKFYEARLRWHITLFLLMPDHLHALLSFAQDESMSEVIRDWKRFHARTNHVIWQQGYFDHRLRADERGEQLSSKMNYLGRILWLWVCARKRNTGRGLSTRSHASIEVDWRGTLSGTMPSHRRRRKMMFPERPTHRKVRRQSRIYFTSALTTTRSTFEEWIGPRTTAAVSPRIQLTIDQQAPNVRQ